jgi:DnaJ-class molecular chaperone
MEIEICPCCKGEGNIKNFFHGEWEIENCGKCNGTGRVIVGRYSYIVPFSTDKNKIYKVDSKIIELIRELEK